MRGTPYKSGLPGLCSFLLHFLMLQHTHTLSWGFNMGGGPYKSDLDAVSCMLLLFIKLYRMMCLQCVFILLGEVSASCT